MLYDVEISPRAWNIQPSSEVEEILQNVLCLLLTHKFSVPLDRAFGISAELIDAPINRQAQLTSDVSTAIRTFEPRARLKKITFRGEYAEGKLTPTATIEIVERNLRG